MRQIAARSHAYPDGSSRRYSRGTIDHWLRAWRKGGLAALKPSPRARHRCGPRPPGTVRRGIGAAAGTAGPGRRADRLDLVS
ncbi:MAG: helix-turn-helix domain-containing protein, partial [Streptosporangiaceae bacterium]